MDKELIRVIYITMFALLSLVLYMVIIPSKQEYKDYKKARRILGFAFMMIAVLEILRILFPPAGLKRFLDLAVVILFSHIFTSLTFVSFLYMIETSRPKRKVVKKAAVISAILIVALGITAYIFIDIRSLIKAVMTSIFLVVCMYEFTCCIREYDKFILQIEALNEDTSSITWMYPMLWATSICALIMACSFFHKPLYIINIISSLGVYMILTMKVLSFVPANLSSIKRKIEEAETKRKEEAEKTETPEETVPQTQQENHEMVQEEDHPEIKKGYAKIEPLISRWVEEESYTQAEISIKDAASQMGTNSNYLSLYINKVLNTSFATWLNTLRIEKSKEYLLDDKKLSIEECGIKVGYPNIYNYSRWFKIVTGMSPSEWRKIQ